ncbi:MAG: TldD/PmbA family protein [Thermoanaerobaculales bacterium]|nr:TldD/PmbA family protein [Thermoanaerobaculales bacterium]
MTPATSERPPFETRWLDELAEGCRGLRGHHPRFEDLYLERRLELRVAAGAELASVQIDGGASRWRFADRWAMHAAAGVSSAAVAGLVSRYADRLDPPPVPAAPPAALAPPAGWIDWAHGLAGRPAFRGAVLRCFVRQAVVVRRDGWRGISTPALVRIEPTGGAPALLAVWGQPLLGDWLRRFSEPAPARTWTPPAGQQRPVVLTEGTAGVLLHELVGHLVEGDLIADGRSPLAGLGGAALTDAVIDLVDDPRRRDLPGAFDCDDEGVPARPMPLLRSGRLCGLLCDRETAEVCGAEAGRGRRSDWRQPPRPRLSNLVVPAGPHPARDLEAGVDRGLVVTRLGGATVDPGSGRAVLRVERGFELQHGRRRRPLGPFELTGSVTEILAGIDPRVGDDPTPDWRLGWCVKDGTPLPTGSEAPTLVVRRLEVL